MEKPLTPKHAYPKPKVSMQLGCQFWILALNELPGRFVRVLDRLAHLQALDAQVQSLVAKHVGTLLLVFGVHKQGSGSH